MTAGDHGRLRPATTESLARHDGVVPGRGQLRVGVTRWSAVTAVLWAVAVGLALARTLDSLRTDDFDGLNNMLQIPLALPWVLVPIGGIWSHETDAWVVAGMGWLNAVLLLLFGPSLLDRPRDTNR